MAAPPYTGVSIYVVLNTSFRPFAVCPGTVISMDNIIKALDRSAGTTCNVAYCHGKTWRICLCLIPYEFRFVHIRDLLVERVTSRAYGYALRSRNAECKIMVSWDMNTFSKTKSETPENKTDQAEKKSKWMRKDLILGFAVCRFMIISRTVHEHFNKRFL